MYIKLRKVFVHTSLNHPVVYPMSNFKEHALDTKKTFISVQNLVF